SLFVGIPCPPRLTPFPYTTLFRSSSEGYQQLSDGVLQHCAAACLQWRNRFGAGGRKTKNSVRNQLTTTQALLINGIGREKAIEVFRSIGLHAGNSFRESDRNRGQMNIN